MALLFLSLALILLASPTRAELSDQEKQYDPTVAAQTGKTGAYKLSVGAIPYRLFLETADYNGALRDRSRARELAQNKPWLVPGKGKNAFIYEVRAPAGYDRSNPAGVVVFINSSKSGKLPDNYAKLLNARNIIAIGANDSGNTEDSILRQSLALYAVELIKRRYAIDPDRVYITGSSGGGRAASHIMFYRPDVFSGGLPMIGVNAPNTRGVTSKNYPNDKYPDGSIAPGLGQMPSDDALRFGKTNGRYALLTGEKDFNRGQAEAIADYMQQQGWRHVTVMVEPKRGHRINSPKYFGKALAFLDEPLIAVAIKSFKDAEKDMQRNKLEEALAGFESSLQHLRISDHAEAKAMLKAGESHVIELNQNYADAVKAVEDAIAAKDHTAASQALRDLQRSWRDRLGREAHNAYRKQIAEARRDG